MFKHAVCVFSTLVVAALISAPAQLGRAQTSATPAYQISSAVLPDGAYFGQKAPGMVPEIFAPGLVSLPDRRETKIAFSPDGKEAFIGASKRLFYTRQERGHWGAPRLAEFLGTEPANDIEPYFSPDGQKLFFVRNGHIWLSTREKDTWAKPSPLPAPINSSADEWHPTVTADGTLYFCSTRNKVEGTYAIYRARLRNGQYGEVEKLESTINSRFGAWDPFIAPDESYMIFSSERPDGAGSHDQYISYLRSGSWSEPKALGPAINTSETEYGSYVTPDGRYYFFSRPVGWGPSDKADLYWVDSRAVLGDGARRFLASSGAASNPASDKYVDRDLPADVAREFAPGVVSFSRGEGIYSERPVFSPDFRECYFDVTDYKNKKFTSFFTRHENGAWTKPEPAFFAARGGFQSAFSSDGQTLLFVAPSPQDAKVAGIWRAQRTAHGWSEPKFLDASVNDGSDARFPGLTANGTLYYLCATKVGDKNRFGVCRAKQKNGRYASVERIDKLQSSNGVMMGDFYVSPDESYIIIYSTLPDNLGQGDLYVSFRGKDDLWSDLRNLGSAVNTKGYDFAPSVTPDGHFIFFTRDRGGEGNVYWISANILDKLRK